MHIHSSYLKHHLTAKIELRKAEEERLKREAEIEAQRKQQELKEKLQELEKMHKQSMISDFIINNSRPRVNKNKYLTHSRIKSPSKDEKHNEMSGDQLEKSFSDSKLKVRSHRRKMNELRNSNEAKLDHYMKSVREMYNNQMAKMKTPAESSRFYDFLKGNKKETTMASKYIKNLSRNNLKFSNVKSFTSFNTKAVHSTSLIKKMEEVKTPRNEQSK